MSILQTIKFLFKSSKAKTGYVKNQVEGLTADQVPHKNGSTFTYTNDGFYITTNNIERFYRWNDIQLITAYKADLLTCDDLRLDIDFGELVLTFSEDMAGWSEFIEMLPQKLPGIKVDWENHVIQRPLVANSTLIFTKEVDTQ
jgi:hypothetical protein